MGWNSFDSFGEMANESDVLEAGEFMASRLLSSGWDTIVVDAGWSIREGTTGKGWEAEVSSLDAFSRPQPDSEKFPSSAEGKGFAWLAHQLHGMGLKFGVHALRGIPRQAVKDGLGVLGTDASAEEAADPSSTCPWSDRMYGLRGGNSASQAYMDSLFQQWADWGVDYVKLDDIASPYYREEIEMACSAMSKTGRPMTLSLSPGNATPMEEVQHLKDHSHLWRISADFWDRWEDLRTNFDLIAAWAPHQEPGAWPDADMLPLGKLCLKWYGEEPRHSRFTSDEAQSLFVLWSVARSPLMLGGQLTSLSELELDLLTNPLLVALNQRGRSPEQVEGGSLRVWRARLEGDVYEAVFNLTDEAVRAAGREGHRVLGEDILAPHACSVWKLS